MVSVSIPKCHLPFSTSLEQFGIPFIPSVPCHACLLFEVCFLFLSTLYPRSLCWELLCSWNMFPVFIFWLCFFFFKQLSKTYHVTQQFSPLILMEPRWAPHDPWVKCKLQGLCDMAWTPASVPNAPPPHWNLHSGHFKILVVTWIHRAPSCLHTLLPPILPPRVSLHEALTLGSPQLSISAAAGIPCWSASQQWHEFLMLSCLIPFILWPTWHRGSHPTWYSGTLPNAQLYISCSMKLLSLKWCHFWFLL